MALHVITGSSVSKRTEEMYRYMSREAGKDPKVTYCLIVPEQASLAAQEALVSMHPDHALTNIDILTFNRLSYRVFQDLHEDERTILTETGKLMLLRLTAEKNEERLPSLKRNLKREGFLNELKSVISELAEYNVSPEKLNEYAGSLDAYPLLRSKLGDISVIYSEFMTMLHRDYEMTEERMKRFSECLGSWEKLPQTVFLLDGFTGFTPLQYEVLKIMLPQAKDVILNVDIGQGKKPEEQKNEDDLFYMSAHMIEELRALAIEHGIQEDVTAVSETMPVSPEIRCIEAGIFNYPKGVFREETDRVRIVRCRDMRTEVSVVLSEILKGVRGGLRYRDMAIVSGTPDIYREELTEQLTDAGIPFFFDEQKEVRSNPLVLLTELLLAAPEADFSFDWVFDIVRNPLITEYIGEVIPDVWLRISETENYVRAFGIRGKAMWQREWEGHYRHFPEVRIPFVNEVREEIADLLTETVDALTAEETTEERCRVIREFFTMIGAEERMLEMAEKFREEGQYELSREYSGSMTAILELLDQAEKILGQTTLPADLFRDVLSSGLSDLRLRMVPPTKDRLVIGDVRRSRLSGVRRLFILGANDGRLPEYGISGGLLSDFDREILKENRLRLSPTSREESFYSRYYLYLLLTRPSESMMLTFASSDTDGRALLPAQVVRELQELFPRMPLENADENSLIYVSTADQGLRTLAVDLRNTAEKIREGGRKELDGTAAALYRWFLDNGGQEQLAQILEGLFMRYNEEHLSDESAKRLFRETVNSSVTRLESYAGCAYAHFLQYGLGLDEREEHEIRPLEIGTLLHKGLELYFGKLKEDGSGFREIADDERSALISECVEEVAEKEAKGLLKDSARSVYMKRRLKRILNRTIRVLSTQWTAGSFDEMYTEEPFRLTVDPRLLDIRGTIDRLDTYEENGKIYARIVDYKSGSRKLDYTKVYYGLQLQLLIYLEGAKALLERNGGGEVVPAGVYYYHIDDPLVPSKEGQDPEDAIRRQLAMRGPTNGEEEVIRLTAENRENLSEIVKSLSYKKDGNFASAADVLTGKEFSELGRFAREKALELSEKMASGRIPVRPYRFDRENGCAFCPYGSVCGFDDRIDGFKKERLKKKELSDLTGHPAEIRERSGKDGK